MLVLAPDHLKTMARAAQAAFPRECCGLLVGYGRRRIHVTRVLPAANLLDGTPDRFELDPRVRVAAERQVRGTPERVIGHYHSHPNGSAHPSATDLAQAWEPDLIWVILGVTGGESGARALLTLAHRLDRARGRVVAVPIVSPGSARQDYAGSARAHKGPQAL